MNEKASVDGKTATPYERLSDEDKAVVDFHVASFPESGTDAMDGIEATVDRIETNVARVEKARELLRPDVDATATPHAYVCLGCKSFLEAEDVSGDWHVVTEHARDCFGNCARAGCPVQEQCGPVVDAHPDRLAVSAPASLELLREYSIMRDRLAGVVKAFYEGTRVDVEAHIRAARITLKRRDPSVDTSVPGTGATA